jgi:hypothetical protein
MKKSTVILSLLFFIGCLYGYAAPRGHLFIIGGGDRPENMMKKFVARAQQYGSGKIIIFPMAIAGNFLYLLEADEEDFISLIKYEIV